MNNRPTVVSLFAGIGGFDLGFDRAGFDIVAHVEIDAHCRNLLTSKWPDAVCLDDVRTAGAHNLPRCDVVTFGFPCQDLSVAGKRAGLAGGRSGLYYEATRIIDELKPSFCLFENVPGLLSSDSGRDFARVLMEMDRIGYNGAWRVLDAQWLGVAQRRRRVFGLFSRLDSGAERCAEILSLQESLRGHPAPSRETGEGVAGCLESRTDGGGFPGTDGACAGHVVPAVVGTLSCNTGPNGHDAGNFASNQGVDAGYLIPAVAGCLQERDAKGSDSDTKPGHLIAVNSGQGFWRESDHAGTLGTEARAVHEKNLVPVAFSCKDGGNDAGDVSPTLRGMGHDASHANGCGQVAVGLFQQSSQAGKGTIGYEPAAPVTKPCKTQQDGQMLHLGAQVRRLTPTECERLQGFPDGWTAGFSDSTRYRMLGNAVAVPCAEWIARRLADRMTVPKPPLDEPDHTERHPTT